MIKKLQLFLWIGKNQREFADTEFSISNWPQRNGSKTASLDDLHPLPEKK